MFCPECGKALSQSSENSEQQSAGDQSSTANEPNVPASIPQSAPVESAPSTSANNAAATKHDASPVSKSGTYEKAREGLHRASTATREVLADNVKRVDKIRHVSSAMIEEATYDPSLRFVLVALALFVVFLALLLLSKVMG